jgi:hypothetical protein
VRAILVLGLALLGGLLVIMLVILLLTNNAH